MAMTDVTLLNMNNLRNSKSSKMIVEQPLDYLTIMVCEKVTDRHPVVTMCLEAIFNNLFKYDIEIRKGKKRVKLGKNIREFLNDSCVTFSKEFIKCYDSHGVVPVSLTVTEKGNAVPIVMKELGYISVISETGRHQGKKFQFYKVTNKKTTNMYANAKPDKKTVVFSGYGRDPRGSGEIISPIAACIDKILFTENEFNCAKKVSRAQCMPAIITEVVDPELFRNSRGMGTSIDINMWYGNRNRHEAVEQDKILYNEAEMRVMSQYNSIIQDQWMQTMGRGISVRGSGEAAAPPPMPMTNLPVGHKMATNIPTPQCRNDLLEIDEREQEIICSILGVPKILFNADVKAVGGVKASSEMFVDTLTEWRSRLSKVLTVIFKSVYANVISDWYTNDLEENLKKTKINSESEISTMLSQIMSQDDITVHFPYLPFDSSEEIWDAFLKGVIDYPDYVIYSKMLKGIPVSDDDIDAKPPWEGLKGIEMLFNTQDDEQQGLLQEKMGIKTPIGVGGKNKKAGEKKRKKTEGKEKKKTEEKEKPKSGEKERPKKRPKKKKESSDSSDSE